MFWERMRAPYINRKPPCIARRAFSTLKFIVNELTLSCNFCCAHSFGSRVQKRHEFWFLVKLSRNCTWQVLDDSKRGFIRKNDQRKQEIFLSSSTIIQAPSSLVHHSNRCRCSRSILQCFSLSSQPHFPTSHWHSVYTSTVDTPEICRHLSYKLFHDAYVSTLVFSLNTIWELSKTYICLLKWQVTKHQ